MKKIFLFCAIFSAFLLSCENDAIVDVNLDQIVEEIKSAQLEGENQRCAELVFPVEYMMSDGTTFTVEAEGGLRTAVIDWYKNNPEKRERPTLVYPVKMNFKGKVFTINNEKEMKKIRMACAGVKGKDDQAMKKRIYGVLMEAGIPKDKLEATMAGLKRVMEEAKGKGREYQMSDELQKYFSERVGLTDKQIEIVQRLAIRILLSKESGADAEKGKGSSTKGK